MVWESLVGQKFGKLTVISEDPDTERSKKFRRWVCLCECGQTTSVITSNLRQGTKSCGCNRRGGGRVRSPQERVLRRLLIHARSRCSSNDPRYYKNYRGRGIKVCDEWNDPKEGIGRFVRYLESLYVDPYSLVVNGYQLDRIDNNRGYEPGNIRLATVVENMNNRNDNTVISAFGKTGTVANMIREFATTNAAKSTIYIRLKSGWDPEKALTAPRNARKDR